ncbi:MAG TPA: hypothetical protein DCE48_17145 [Lachnospiraceae bacterium]|nr:hypothetical protein [Lachnospiraceae bacterium]
MGKNKIALVDSRIDVNLFRENIIGDYSLLPMEKQELCNVHGTLCCSAIIKINPLAKIYAISVLDERNRSSSQNILDAMYYLSNIDIDIINLSLSTNNLEWEKDYQKIIRKLRRQGKIIIASLANDHSISVPARLPEVLGVQGNSFRNSMEYWFNRSYEIQCVANANPAMLKSGHGGYQLFGGNSKATAVFTGIVSKIWDDSIEIESFLEDNSKKGKWAEIKAEKMEMSPIKPDMELFNRLRQVIITVFKISKENEKKLGHEELFNFGLTSSNAIILLKEIEKEFQIRINYENVTLYWFYSLESLYYEIFIKGKDNERL